MKVQVIDNCSCGGPGRLLVWKERDDQGFESNVYRPECWRCGASPGNSHRRKDAIAAWGKHVREGRKITPIVVIDDEHKVHVFLPSADETYQDALGRAREYAKGVTKGTMRWYLDVVFFGPIPEKGD